MLEPSFYDHPTDQIQLIETHISWVFLTGQFAYKVKKPVDFGFLDFTRLEKRKYYCEEELRLNGRLAPDTYLSVIPITLCDETFTLNDTSHIVEYVIKMKEFPQDCLLQALLKKNLLNASHIQELAKRLAISHDQIAIAPEDSKLGQADEVFKPIEQNFIILEPLLESGIDKQHLETIKQASFSLFKNIYSFLQKRKEGGFIRECHGDMHLGNIALVNDEILIFDGIEFNDSFKWIDTMSELAFLVMDLQDHDQAEFANLVLNQYLQITGDYNGIRVFRLYLLYRAMVRAKVAGLRFQQQDKNSDAYRHSLEELHNYFDLALSYVNYQEPGLILMHGVSGTGKSWLSEKLAEQLGIIILRSDMERKRIFRPDDKRLYSKEATQKTYQTLYEYAQTILDSKYSVIVDATFLDQYWRRSFYELSRNMDVKFHIVSCTADLETLKQRLIKRAREQTDISDADIDVMQKQIDNYKPLESDKLEHTVEINTDKQADLAEILIRLQQ